MKLDEANFAKPRPTVGDALANLEQSRARLWQQLVQPAASPLRDTATASSLFSRACQFVKDRLPGTTGKLFDSAGVWWHNHPLRLPAEIISEQAHERMADHVRRHPLLAAGLASMAGAAIAWFRPWRSPSFAKGLLRTRRLAGNFLWNELQRPATQAIFASFFLSQLDSNKKSWRQRKIETAEVEQVEHPFAPRGRR